MVLQTVVHQPGSLEDGIDFAKQRAHKSGYWPEVVLEAREQGNLFSPCPDVFVALKVTQYQYGKW